MIDEIKKAYYDLLKNDATLQGLTGYTASDPRIYEWLGSRAMKYRPYKPSSNHLLGDRLFMFPISSPPDRRFSFRLIP